MDTSSANKKKMLFSITKYKFHKMLRKEVNVMLDYLLVHVLSVYQALLGLLLMHGIMLDFELPIANLFSNVSEPLIQARKFSILTLLLLFSYVIHMLTQFLLLCMSDVNCWLLPCSSFVNFKKMRRMILTHHRQFNCSRFMPMQITER